LASYINDKSAPARTSQEERDSASSLRARAMRYRLLAENLFDPGVIAVVLASARELEIEAALIDEQANPEDSSLIGFHSTATKMPGRDRPEDI
jgi:hypothetical protein